MGGASRRVLVLVILASAFIVNCRHGDVSRTAPRHGTSSRVYELELPDGITAADKEFSGLAWYRDYLILLPQFPSGYEANADGVLHFVSRSDLTAQIGEALEGKEQHDLPIRTLDFRIEGQAEVEDFDGYEALCFRGESVYLTIETVGQGRANSLLVKGRTETDRGGRPVRVVVDMDRRWSLQQWVARANSGFEALACSDDGILALFEVNSSRNSPPNTEPRACLCSVDLEQARDLVMFPLDYRLTDCTDTDGERRFWAINYLWPGDRDLRVKGDRLLEALGYAPRAGREATDHVERLVEFEMRADSIVPSGRPPVLLELVREGRNWEGIVRMGQGFVLVTDKHPSTVLAYVEPGRTKED